jgi:hypothetical protein
MERFWVDAQKKVMVLIGDWMILHLIQYGMYAKNIA